MAKKTQKQSVAFIVQTNEDPAEIGRKAGQNWSRGEKLRNLGNQQALIAVMQAFNSQSFVSVVETKEGNEIGNFDLADYEKAPLQPDGKRDNKLNTARNISVMWSLFGLREGEFTNNQINVVKDCVMITRYLFDNNYGLRHVVWNTSRNCVELPYNALFEKPEQSAKQAAKDAFEIYDRRQVYLNRSKLHGKMLSFETLKNVAYTYFNPKEVNKKGADTKKVGDPTTFINSVDFVSTQLDMLLNPDKNPNGAVLALSKDGEAKLNKLLSLAQAYFSASKSEQDAANKANKAKAA